MSIYENMKSDEILKHFEGLLNKSGKKPADPEKVMERIYRYDQVKFKEQFDEQLLDNQYLDSLMEEDFRRRQEQEFIDIQPNEEIMFINEEGEIIIEEPKQEEELDISETVKMNKEEGLGLGGDIGKLRIKAKMRMEEVHTHLMTEEQLNEKSQEDLIHLISQFSLMKKGHLNPLETMSKVELAEVSRKTKLNLNVMDMDIEEVRERLIKYHSDKENERKRWEKSIREKGLEEEVEVLKEKHKDTKLEDLEKIVKQKEQELKKLQEVENTKKKDGIKVERELMILKKELKEDTQEFNTKKDLIMNKSNLLQSQIREIEVEITEHKDRDLKSKSLSEEEYETLISKKKSLLKEKDELKEEMDKLTKKFYDNDIHKTIKFHEDMFNEKKLEFKKRQNERTRTQNETYSLKRVYKDKENKDRLKKRVTIKYNEYLKQRKIWGKRLTPPKDVQKLLKQIDEGKRTPEQVNDFVNVLDNKIKERVQNIKKMWENSKNKGKRIFSATLNEIFKLANDQLQESEMNMLISQGK